MLIVDTFLFVIYIKINAFIRFTTLHLYIIILLFFYNQYIEELLYHFMNSVRLDVWSSDDYDDSRSYNSFIGNNFSEMDQLKRRNKTNAVQTQKEGNEPFKPLELDENDKTQKP